MIFANPLLLAGTALVALPIVLHLIMRRRPKHIEFPALRFVRRRREANQRRLRLRHLLLLALRTAAIAALAFALARPSMQFGGAWGSQEAPEAAALVFDTAVRMDYRQENRTRLEVAGEFGQWLLRQLPDESQVAVVDSRPGGVSFQVDRSAAGERIARLESTAYARPLLQSVEEALRLVGESPLARKEVYLFSDLAESAWPASAAGRIQDRLAENPGVALYVVDVGAARPTNFSLGDLRLQSQVVSHRSAARMEVEVDFVGDGTHPRSVELYTLEDGKPQKRNAQTFELAPGEAKKAEFRIGNLGVGPHQGFLRIAGQDGLAADDTRFFTVEVRPAWKVLVAAPAPAEAYALFLVEALAPEAFRKQGRARFDCTVSPLAELGKRPLRDFACVCLLDPGPLDAAVWRSLADYAGEGRGVGIFLGRNAKPLSAFNSQHAQAVLGGKLLVQARRPDGQVHLAPRSYQHPILAAFAPQAGSIPWDAFPVLRCWELELAPGAAVVLALSDDRPALVERAVGSGRSLTMTTPISDRPNEEPWNLLPAGEAWPFVILANQMVGYLVGSAAEQLNYFAGQTAVVSLDRSNPHAAYVLSAPGDLKISLSPDTARNVVAATTTERPGNYRLQAGGAAGGFDRGFSVNVAAAETRLARVGEEQIKEIFGPYPFRLVRTEDQLDREMSAARVGRELYPWLIALVALVLAGEHLVANRFYRDGEA